MDEQDYEPSSTVKTCSSKIASDTGGILFRGNKVKNKGVTIRLPFFGFKERYHAAYSRHVIVLTYKPPKGVLQLIEMIEKQDYPIQKLILMNTEEKYFDERFYGTGFLEKIQQYRSAPYLRQGIRPWQDKTVQQHILMPISSSVVTQDAIPADTALIGHLVEALQQPKVAAAYARQLPLPDCREIEKYTRSFNYPEESRIKSKDDIAELGIKTFFCSNAAQHITVISSICWVDLEKRAIFNEDMIYAGHARRQAIALHIRRRHRSIIPIITAVCSSLEEILILVYHRQNTLKYSQECPLRVREYS